MPMNTYDFVRSSERIIGHIYTITFLVNYYASLTIIHILQKYIKWQS